MKILPASKSIPAWQTERSKKIHRACLRLQAAIAGGESMSKAARRIARNFNGRRIMARPGRHMTLGAGSLCRLFKVWQCGGGVPSALIIKYRPRRSSIPAPLFIRFVEFCAKVPQRDLKTAWQNFAARKGHFGRGRRARRPVSVTYGQVCYNFSSRFRQMQARQKAIATAQIELAAVRRATIADIHRRLRGRPARQTAAPQPEFEI